MHPKLFDLALIIGLGILYPVVHLANAWLFSFAEVSPNIGLIYLPAFLRLMNVLVLGKLRGTVAGLLGGVLLVLADPSPDPLLLRAANIACSAAGPLIAVLLFEHWRKRPVNLLSLPDLAQVTVLYCLANALVHHLVWALIAPQNFRSPDQVLWMILGDMLGTLIGAYLLKWGLGRMPPARPLA